MEIAKLLSPFRSIFIWLSVVAYLLLASLERAIFSSHAVFAVVTASSNTLDARANARSILDCRIPESPNSSNTEIVSSPFSFIFPSPPMKALIASIGSLPHISANSEADTPAIFANVSRSSPPADTALLIAVIVWVIAVPPASALMPTEDIAVDNARISCSDNPATVPADARRVAISTISRSVVAKLLPRSTMVLPSLEYSSAVVPVMLANLASAEAASSAERFVASPKSIMTRVKSSTSSVAIPNCPAASATAAISVVDAGISSAMSNMPCRSAASCSVVPSTVFSTPAKALSNSTAAFVAATPAPAKAKDAGANFFAMVPDFSAISPVTAETCASAARLLDASACRSFSFSSALVSSRTNSRYCFWLISVPSAIS